MCTTQWKRPDIYINFFIRYSQGVTVFTYIYIYIYSGDWKIRLQNIHQLPFMFSSLWGIGQIKSSIHGWPLYVNECWIVYSKYKRTTKRNNAFFLQYDTIKRVKSNLCSPSGFEKRDEKNLVTKVKSVLILGFCAQLIADNVLQCIHNVGNLNDGIWYFINKNETNWIETKTKRNETRTTTTTSHYLYLKWIMHALLLFLWNVEMMRCLSKNLILEIIDLVMKIVTNSIIKHESSIALNIMKIRTIQVLPMVNLGLDKIWREFQKRN